MPNNKIPLVEPCSECPIPTNFIIKAVPKKEKESPTKYSVECRECGDNWIEVIEDES